MSVPDPDALDLRRSDREGATVLTLSGDVDARGAPALRTHLVDAIEDVGGLIVIDLTAVPYVDSMGLGTLVGALKRARERGATLRLVITSPQVHKVLQITGLSRVFDLYETVDAAIQGRE